MWTHAQHDRKGRAPGLVCGGFRTWVSHGPAQSPSSSPAAHCGAGAHMPRGRKRRTHCQQILRFPIGENFSSRKKKSLTGNDRSQAPCLFLGLISLLPAPCGPPAAENTGLLGGWEGRSAMRSGPGGGGAWEAGAQGGWEGAVSSSPDAPSAPSCALHTSPPALDTSWNN